MSGQVVSFLSMCKHRKMLRRAISCTAVGADQGWRLSTCRVSLSSATVNTFQCQNRCELKAKHSNPRASGHCPCERPGAPGHWESSVWQGPGAEPSCALLTCIMNLPTVWPPLQREGGHHPHHPYGCCFLLDSLHPQLLCRCFCTFFGGASGSTRTVATRLSRCSGWQWLRRGVTSLSLTSRRKEEVPGSKPSGTCRSVPCGTCQTPVSSLLNGKSHAALHLR